MLITIAFLGIFPLLADISPPIDRSVGPDLSNPSNISSNEVLHKVGIVGTESGRVLSNDPETREARIAEAIGSARFCGKTVGTLTLIQHNNRNFLIGTAHSFYEDGHLLCEDALGFFAPDLHYGELADGKMVGSREIDRKRLYAFKLPPLNHDTALTYAADKLDPQKIDDFVILEIEDISVLQSQFGEPREVIKLASIDPSNLSNLSKVYEVFLIARRQNFSKYRQASVEYGCMVGNIESMALIKKHSCDTGGGASGSLLNFFASDGDAYAIGMHYAGRDSSMDDFNDINSREGNFFIPSLAIIDAINLILDRPTEF